MLKRVARKIKRMCFPQDPAKSLYFGNLDAYRDLAGDEYVVWIRHILGGYLDAGNVKAFECCIKNMPATGAIIEIGSFLGLSTNVLAYAVHKYQRTNPFFACDPWDFTGHRKKIAGYISNDTPEYRDWVKQIFRMNTSLFSRNIAPYTFEAFSDRFFELWQSKTTMTDIFGREAQLGGPIAFAYIDGDHSYEGAKRDFDNVNRDLLPGGYVLLDDSADNCSFDGVQRVVAEVMKMPTYELVLKSPHYCFKKK